VPVRDANKVVDPGDTQVAKPPESIVAMLGSAEEKAAPPGMLNQQLIVP
jgi:hypothetical protein